MRLQSQFYCLFAIAIWSSLEITGKLVGAGMDPFALTAWRFVIGGLALLPFAARQKVKTKLQVSSGSILRVCLLGILNVCASMLLLQLAIYYGKASVTAVIVAMNPLFVSLFAMLLIREKLDWIQGLCLGMGIFGLMLIVVFEQDMNSAAFLNLSLSISLAATASVTFGLYTVLTKNAVVKYGNLFTNSVSFLAGGLVLLLITWLIGRQVQFSLTMPNLIYMAWLGLVVTGLAYILYFEGMKVIGASRASLYFFLKPALASLLAWWILKETLSFGQLVGVMIIIVSLAIRGLWMQRREKPA